jgi:cyclomaltodextrinase / maltogenic alpha-amylase / neopullulanase
VHDIEMKYYGEPGFLYPFDVRYYPNDRAFCDLLPDGRLRFCIWTQPAFAEAVLVFNDGKPQALPMTRLAGDSRFTYWEALIRPAAAPPAGGKITYSFALKTLDGWPVYWSRHGIDHSIEILDRYTLDVSAMAPFQTPDWAKGAVIYQIFPDRFANGDPANDPQGTVPWGSPPAWLEYQGGDLQGITQKLDYLEDLGVDILYLTPIFTSPSTHKYDCSDFYHVHPGFGGNEALRALVDGLHRRGMKIVLDASFNHCHPRFFAFQDLVRNGPSSRYKDWFTVREWPVRVKYRPRAAELPQTGRRDQYLRFLETFPQVTGVDLEEATDDGPLVEATYLAWYGVLDMPKLNLSNPETRAYFLDVTRYWLREFKIDGWRMDVARHIVPDFWDDFRRAAKEVNPDCYLLAEIWGNTSPWLQGAQFDATMNYFFRDLVMAYFATLSMDTATFIAGVHHMLALYAPQVTHCTYNLFSSHDISRLRFEAGEDVVRLRLATLFQLTMPGAPGIYYGDEIAMSGGGDPDNRRAFPWDRPETWDRETLDLTRTLIRLRKEHPALRLGEYRPAWQGENAFAFERVSEAERVLVVINRGGPIERLDLSLASGQVEILWGHAQVMAESDRLVLRGLEARTGVILRV